MNPFPRYNEKGELDTRLRVDPVTGDVGIGTPKEKEHMTKDEALQLALGSMKEIIHWYAVRDRNDVFLNFVDQNPEIQKIMKSITAIKEALETKDEPVACAECGADGGHALYCVACAEKFVKREWIWLTDKEVDECLQGLPTQTIDVYARRIEIKIKDKNT